MKKVFVHGLGQTSKSWDDVISYMTASQDISCPDLSKLLVGQKATYHLLYQAFTDYCQKIDGKIALCGLSLGGVLALNYALDYPDRVHSLVLIGTPCRVPKTMLIVQSILFHCFPKTFFQKMGFCKKDILTLTKSMKDLDFFRYASNITCPALIVCGKKDKANMKSSYYFYEHIQKARLDILDNAGHVVNEDQPRMLARLLDEYYGGVYNE